MKRKPYRKEPLIEQVDENTLRIAGTGITIDEVISKLFDYEHSGYTPDELIGKKED